MQMRGLRTAHIAGRSIHRPVTLVSPRNACIRGSVASAGLISIAVNRAGALPRRLGK